MRLIVTTSTMRIVLFLAAVLAVSSSVWAQGGAVEEQEQWELRTYDLGDLVLDVRDYPFSSGSHSLPAPGFGGGGGGFGGAGMGGGGFFSVPDDIPNDAHNQGAARRFTGAIRYAQFGGGGRMDGAAGSVPGAAAPASDNPANITVGDIQRVIYTTIAADSWAIGGGEGQIEQLGTSLVVWQSVNVHRAIENLLDQLRSGSADRPTLTIDARWLLLDSAELEQLWGRDEEGGRRIDRKALDSFTRRRGSIRGISHCFSGQLVYVVSGTRRNFVHSYIPVVGSLENGRGETQLAARTGGASLRLVSNDGGFSGGSDKGVGYQPMVNVENLGALLEIRPTALRGSRGAVVDLRSTITVPGAQGDGPPASAGMSGLAPAVDRVAIETQELATSLRVPLGEPVLVGGLTYDPVGSQTAPLLDAAGASAAAEEQAERPQMYFVLEISRAHGPDR